MLWTVFYFLLHINNYDWKKNRKLQLQTPKTLPTSIFRQRELNRGGLLLVVVVVFTLYICDIPMDLVLHVYFATRARLHARKVVLRVFKNLLFYHFYFYQFYFYFYFISIFFISIFFTAVNQNEMKLYRMESWNETTCKVQSRVIK
jgi:hypothetical protein